MGASTLRRAASAAALALLALGCRGASSSPTQPELRAYTPTRAGAARAAGPILSLVEHDEDGGRTALNRTHRFVDVNSRFDLKVSRQAVEAQLIARETSLDPDAIEALLAAQEAARDGLQGLAPLAAAAEAWAADPQGAQAELQQALQAIALPALSLLDEIDRPQSLLRPVADGFNAALETGPARGPIDQYRLLFELVDTLVGSYRAVLDRDLADAAFGILLEARMTRDGAWRNVHLDGFDTYPTEERFRVERWRIAPTPEEEAKLEQMAALADSLNAGETSLGSLARRTLRAYVDGIVKQAEECMDRAERDLDALRGRAEAYLEAERTQIDELLRLARRLRDDLRRLFDHYGSGSAGADPSGVLAALQGDLARVSGMLFELGTGLSVWADRSRFEAAGHSVATDVLAILDGLGACGAKLTGDVRARLRELTDLIGLTDGLETTIQTIGAYGDKVLRHTLDDLPPSTQLDLIDTGQRSPGDALVFRIGFVKVDPETSEAQGTPTTLEQHQFELEQILVHFESAVTLGFADPNGRAEVNSTWQVVPAYSLLLKRGSRQSGYHNRLLDPGYGLHMSALDFDGDDTPELGVGVVLSLFRDYLQAGYGYNLSEDRWYGFFGIGVPLSVLGDAANGAIR
ncbi:MAG: hypothetical protein AAF682_05245 [Planctomycetota bacterium]